MYKSVVCYKQFVFVDVTKATQILLDLNIRSMGPISEVDRVSLASMSVTTY